MRIRGPVLHENFHQTRFVVSMEGTETHELLAALRE